VHEADEVWPFAYCATQWITLSHDMLMLELHLENKGQGNMPCGLGFHPYFRRPSGTRLEAAVERVWLVNDTEIPTERIAVPENWSLAQGLLLDTPILDNCFDGFGGEAKLFLPEREKPLRLSSAEATHLIVYCPKDEAFVCVEPATHMPDAFNRAAAGFDKTGYKFLEPGKTLSLTMSLSPGIC
jgi:aldose 1-epimerase